MYDGYFTYHLTVPQYLCLEAKETDFLVCYIPKGTDQPAHPLSLISAFAINSLESNMVICKPATCTCKGSMFNVLLKRRIVFLGR